MSEELKDKKDGSNSEGSPNEFVELLKKNKKSLAVIVVIAVVLLGIGILLGSLIGSRSGKNNNLQAGAQSSEPAETQTETAVPDVPLEENADPEVNALMEKYYQASCCASRKRANTWKAMMILTAIPNRGRKRIPMWFMLLITPSSMI